MAVADDPFDATELVAFIPEVWSSIVNEEFFAKAVASNFFLDVSAWGSGGGDTIHIPNAFTNSFSVQTQATQGTIITTDAPATTDDTLAINNHVYVAFLVGDKDAIQIARGTYNINQIYARQAGGVLLEDLEGDIFGLQSSVATNTVNDTASVLNDVDIRNALSTQETNDVPFNEQAFFFHPNTYWTQLHAIAKYTDASQAGWAGNPPLVSGNYGVTPAQANSLRGTLYGVPVYTSSKVVNATLGVKNLLAHKNTFAFAVQTPGTMGRIRVQSQYLLDFVGNLVVLDMVNGVKEVRQEAAVLLNASNSFLAS